MQFLGNAQHFTQRIEVHVRSAHVRQVRQLHELRFNLVYLNLKLVKRGVFVFCPKPSILFNEILAQRLQTQLQVAHLLVVSL